MALSDYFTETIKVVTITHPGQFSTSAYSESCSTHKAAVNPVNGIETFSGGRNEPFADYKAFVSSTVTITESNRVKYGTGEYNVVFVKNTLAKDHHKLVFLKDNARAV